MDLLKHYRKAKKKIQEIERAGGENKVLKIIDENDKKKRYKFMKIEE